MKYKYYLLDTKNISRKLYENTRMMVANDFVNDYDQVGEINASALFENLPLEYRKIIIKIPKNIFKKKDAREYNSSHPLKIKIDKNNIISGSDILYTDIFTWVFDNTVSLNGQVRELSIEEVKIFYATIKADGYLETYLEDINNLFDYTYKPNKQLSMIKK